MSPSIALRRSLSSPAALFVKVMASTFQRRAGSDPQQAQLVQRGGAAAAHRRFEVVDVLLRDGAADGFGAVRLAKADDVGDAVDQHRCFGRNRAPAGSAAAFGGKNRLALYRVELGKAGFDVLVAQGDEFLGKCVRHAAWVLRIAKSRRFRTAAETQ